MDGLHSLLDCSPPVSVRGLLQGLSLIMYFTEQLLPRFNVASFCLELLQDVHSTKHMQGFCAACSDVQPVSVGNS